VDVSGRVFKSNVTAGLDDADGDHRENRDNDDVIMMMMMTMTTTTTIITKIIIIL